MKVVLIPCASTTWRSAGRLLGRVALDPTIEGVNACDAWTEALRTAGVGRILHAPDALCTQTAKKLAKTLGVKASKVGGLDEVDLGLWAGLTADQLAARYETTYEELCESPLNVTPPEGEMLGDAADRIRAALTKQMKKNGVAAVGVVLRPFAFALAQHVLRESNDEADIWPVVQDGCAPVEVAPISTS